MIPDHRLDQAMKIVLEEAGKNPEFAARIAAALAVNPRPSSRRRNQTPGARRANRRAPAAFDPVRLAREGEEVLRTRLGKLSVEQLKDIVADFGMDSDRLAMKWKSAERIIDRIVKVSIVRANKGSAFM